MKLLFLGFVFLILTISAKAQTLEGRIKLFSGRSVETHHVYSYYALETEDHERIILPSWFDSKMVAKIQGHGIKIEGALQYTACTDMSEACPTGQINRVRWMQINTNNIASRHEVYTGVIKRFAGQAIESRRSYDYLALAAGQERIEIPKYLDARKLHVLNPQVTIIGETVIEACSEMSEACGPQRLHSTSMIKLQF